MVSEVYVLISPTFGIVSEIVSRFAHKPVFGKTVWHYRAYDKQIGIAVWAIACIRRYHLPALSISL
ncbi:MAG: hypothetical protein ACTS6G_00565 [Candidatus Hodgkinia cicadicola]